MVVTSGQQYSVGKKPTVILLYALITLIAICRDTTPNKKTKKDTMSLYTAIIINSNINQSVVVNNNIL